MTSTHAHASPRSPQDSLNLPLRHWLAQIEASPDSAGRQAAVHALIRTLTARGTPLVHDSTAEFVYIGTGRHVALAGDFNGWDTARDSLRRVPGTLVSHTSIRLDTAARCDYKLVVDGVWLLDPMNPRQCMSGFGPNSELRMPAYRPPEAITFDPSILHGTIDTLVLRSTLLGRTHPVYVYLPHSYPSGRKKLPLIVVTDGGEYLSLGLMNNVLDNLIAARKIQPVVAVFLDPRTDPADRRTNTRMQDYALRDTFVQSLTRELLPMIRKGYRVSGNAKTTAIMGASLGGLIAAYAAWSRPDDFGMCAAQSPAFSWNSSRIINDFAQSARKPLRLYIDTGTLHDAQAEARKMCEVLTAKNYRFRYAEYPEGHSWGSWRARIADILLYFYGMK